MTPIFLFYSRNLFSPSRFKFEKFVRVVIFSVSRIAISIPFKPCFFFIETARVQSDTHSPTFAFTLRSAILPTFCMNKLFFSRLLQRDDFYRISLFSFFLAPAGVIRL